jgi:formylglycine-generating enzyme required for sulfatase activity
MVFVEGGTFTMGCIPERDGVCQDYELPAHSVTVSSFYIGKYEITRAQWVSIRGGNNDLSPVKTDDQLPVQQVTYLEAIDFINLLNTATGKNYRLPTEAEWEYAARGGNKSQHYMYSGSNNLNEIGWYQNNSNGGPHPVGQKKPNELGIYDMTGSVWEWCFDWYSAYSSVAQTNPTGPNTGTLRVRRGSTWRDAIDPPYLRNASRLNKVPTSTDAGMGFRVALDAQ